MTRTETTAMLSKLPDVPLHQPPLRLRPWRKDCATSHNRHSGSRPSRQPNKRRTYGGTWERATRKTNGLTKHETCSKSHGRR